MIAWTYRVLWSRGTGVRGNVLTHQQIDPNTGTTESMIQKCRKTIKVSAG